MKKTDGIVLYSLSEFENFKIDLVNKSSVPINAQQIRCC